LTRILLADDHQIVRECLRILLEKNPGMEVIAEADNGLSAVEMVRKNKPDIVIMDITLPVMNGMEATRRILEETPSVRVLALSMHTDKQFIREMFRAGASAYLPKDCACCELADAIETVMRGQRYLSPRVANLVIRDFVENRGQKDASSLCRSYLSSRQKEVLALLSEGKNTRKIAAQLKISEKTIETHRRQLMGKLGLHSVAELTKYAIREGITFV
jgi:DNA-binding NarL/FixJ family response regulator